MSLRRDRAVEPLGRGVEDVVIVVRPANLLEADVLEVFFEHAELADAFVAVGADSVADLNVDLLGTRRVRDLRGRGRTAGEQAQQCDRHTGSTNGGHDPSPYSLPSRAPRFTVPGESRSRKRPEPLKYASPQRVSVVDGFRTHGNPRAARGIMT